MAQDRIAGNQSSFTLNGTVIPITKYTPKVNRKLADTTDTGDYDATSTLIANSQVPVSYHLELNVEGKFRKSVTPTALIAELFTGATAIPVVLTLAQGVLFGHGNFDLSDFSCDVPAEDTVTFSCTLKSNGPFTPNA
jgi:hypothetical protein